MIIRLEEIPESRLPEFKGGEKELRANMFFDGTNRMFRGTLVPGASIGIHTHGFRPISSHNSLRR